MGLTLIWGGWPGWECRWMGQAYKSLYRDCNCHILEMGILKVSLKAFFKVVPKLIMMSWDMTIINSELQLCFKVDGFLP